MDKLKNIFNYFYIIAGIVLIGVGFAHDAFDLLYSLITGSLIVVGLLPILLKEKGEVAAVYLSRIFVGSLFVVSGLIKANDTLGFSYKLLDYFAESALNWTVFEPYSLSLSILIASSEVVLGFAVLFGGKSKLASWSLLGMILFFSWLTFYTAKCDPLDTYIASDGVERTVTCVTDCGCFGDALKGSIGRSLTPWESFKKDILLLVYVIVLLFNMDKIKLNNMKDDVVIFPASILFVIGMGGMLFGWWLPLWFTIVVMALFFVIKQFGPESFDKEWQIAIMVALVCFGFSFYTYSYLPQKDFRPYAVGKSIPEQMKSAEELGKQPPIYATQYTFTDTATGKDTLVLSTDWMKIYKEPWFKKYKGKSWDGPTVKVSDGYEPPIMGFGIGDEEQTEEILSNPKPVFVLVAYDITHTDEDVQPMVNEFAAACEANGIEFYGSTSSGYEDVEKFRHEYQNAFDYLSGDEKILKTIVRANPGLVLLKEGVVVAKWHYNTFPKFADVQKEYLN